MKERRLADLVHQIGELLVRCASVENDTWDHVGWVFVPRAGRSYEGELFRYHTTRRVPVSLGARQREAADMMFQIREITPHNDAFWKACIIGVEQSSGKVRILFEFEDASRWRVSPSTVEQTRAMLLSGLFPEAVS